MTTLLYIVADTPRWVVALLFLLLAVGLRQMRDRRVTPARLAAMPIAMAALSCYGVASDFGAQPIHVVAWGAGAWLALSLMLRRPTPQLARYDAETGMIRVQGSAAPLALMLAIFGLKYVVAVTLIVKPTLRQELPWTLAGAAVYGMFVGLFAGRAWRLGWRWLRAPTAARKAL
jgi:hypothetical protein